MIHVCVMLVCKIIYLHHTLPYSNIVLCQLITYTSYYVLHILTMIRRPAGCGEEG